MATKDANLAVRSASDGDLGSDGFTSAEIRLKGAPIKGYALEVVIPAETGTTPTLDIYIYSGTATGVTSDSSLIGQTPVQITSGIATGVHIIPFHLPIDHEYIKVKFDVTGTSPHFSEVEAWIVHQVGKKWSRAIHFD